MLDGFYYDRDGSSITGEQWRHLFENKAYCRVAFDQIDGVEVSTVWLGMNHNYSMDGPPLIFETMVFGGELGQEQWRYSTEQAALTGHQYACEIVRLELALRA